MPPPPFRPLFPLRARWRLGEVPIIPLADEEKRKYTHVNLEEQRRHHRALCLWQARLGITYGVATDASRVIRRNERGYPVYNEYGEAEKDNALAWINHWGEHESGHFTTEVGADNYLISASSRR